MGFKKSNIPWNKGKHPKYMQGKNHPMFGKHPIAWNKGIKGNKFKKHYPNGIKGVFEKSHIPWSKGTKGIVKAWNKGLPPEKTTNWRGGKITSVKGYIFIKQHSHPRANNQGYVHHSHLVMEKMIGRFLTPKEVVHHKGIKYSISSVKNKQDDRIENLQLFPNNSKHSKFHYPKGFNPHRFHKIK